MGKARGGSKWDNGSSGEITCNNSGGGRMCTGEGILKEVGVHTCISKGRRKCEKRGVMRTSHVSLP